MGKQEAAVTGFAVSHRGKARESLFSRQVGPVPLNSLTRSTQGLASPAVLLPQAHPLPRGVQSWRAWCFLACSGPGMGRAGARRWESPAGGCSGCYGWIRAGLSWNQDVLEQQDCAGWVVQEQWGWADFPQIAGLGAGRVVCTGRRVV